jgi:DNA-binding response OmpR family regulator
MKILIIEDSQDVVTSLQLCFKILMPAAEVISNNLGTDGIESVKNENPDVVILDLGLPDMDGKNVLQEIRRFSNTPVTVLSVRNQDSDREGCFAAGATDYITKPYSAIELVSRIKKMLKEKA